MFHMIDMDGSNTQYELNYKKLTVAKSMSKNSSPLGRMDYEHKVLASDFNKKKNMVAVASLNCFYTYKMWLSFMLFNLFIGFIIDIKLIIVIVCCSQNECNFIIIQNMANIFAIFSFIIVVSLSLSSQPTWTRDFNIDSGTLIDIKDSSKLLILNFF